MKFLWVGVFLGLAAIAQADDRINCVEADRSTKQSLTAKSKSLLPGKADWIKPGGAFSFKVECQEQLAAQYRLKLDLYQGDKALATSEILLARGHPIIWQTPEKTWRIWVD